MKSIKISSNQRSSRKHQHTMAAFSLIELLIVIALVAILTGIAVSNFGQIGNTQLRTQTNKLAAALKYTFGRAVSHGLYMRMVFDFEQDAYWVEASEQPVFLSKKKRGEDQEEGEQNFSARALRKEEQELKKRERRSQKSEEDLKKESKPLPMQALREKFKKEDVIAQVKLENGCQIDGIFTSQQEDVFRQGKAYIHFFPSGFSEPAMIYISDGKDAVYTLILNHQTGKVAREAGRIDPDKYFAIPEDIEDEGR
jgi:general secretion pathway protein H